MTFPAANVWRQSKSRSWCLDCWRICLDLLEFRLPMFRGRAVRIEAGCARLASPLGLSQQEIFELKLASRFHDLGMLGIPDRLLLKTSTLTPEERSIVNQHVVFGGRLMHSSFPDFPNAVEAIWYHHERPDGRGPFGLDADTLPILANAIALVEAVESMANDRPYRSAKPFDEIVSEIERGNGQQFLPLVVTAFRRVAREVYDAVHVRPETTEDAAQPGLDVTAGVASPPTAAAGPPCRIDDAAGRSAPCQMTHQAQRAKPLLERPPLIDAQDIASRINKGLELKPLAPLVQNVMGLTTNARCSAEDVAQAVIQDQALSIQLLKLANSSVYCRGRPVRHVKEAISRIGISGVRNLLMTIGVLQHFDEHVSARMDARLFWEHSLACGLLATTLATERRVKNVDDYFLWGILHDTGRAVLLEQVPEEYAEVLDTAAELGLPLEVVERRLLSIDHCQVLKTALLRWGFPVEFIQPIVNHHRALSEMRQLGPDHAEAAATVALANMLCHALLLGSSGNDIVGPLDELVELIGLQPTALEQLASGMPDELQSMKLTLMARVDPAGWPDYVSIIGERMQTEVRPLCVSNQPATDPWRMILERVSPSAEGPPNLGILYLRRPKELDHVLSSYQARENNSGAGALPVIMICGKGKVATVPEMLANRPHAVLTAPVRIDAFQRAIHQVLGCSGPPTGEIEAPCAVAAGAASGTGVCT